jgi:hypothetical protein
MNKLSSGTAVLAALVVLAISTTALAAAPTSAVDYYPSSNPSSTQVADSEGEVTTRPSSWMLGNGEVGFN